ncbi:MAG: glycosyltransferase family 2 protein [Armatimonadota bacterium]
MVSCVIPTLKRERLLAEAVESVLSQEAPGVDVEVVVVNDAGEPLSPAGWQNDNRVTVFHTYNTERCVARNTGAALSRGDYLHFLDDDDMLLPGAYAAFGEAARRNPEAVWITAPYEAVLGDGGATIVVHPVVDGSVFARLVAGIGVPLGSSWVSRKAFLSAGGFDPSFTVMEDLEFLQRLVLEGPVEYCEFVVARFRMGRHPLSTTNWDESSDACRMQREKAFGIPNFLRVLEASLRCKDTAQLRGRLVRFCVGSALRHLRKGSACIAVQRFGMALRLAMPGIARSGFWRGLGTGVIPGDSLACQLERYEKSRTNRI